MTGNFMLPHVRNIKKTNEKVLLKFACEFPI